MTKRIAIYRDTLLATSETFIKVQAEGLNKYTPYYVGIRQDANGLTLPPSRTLILNTDESVLSKLKRYLFYVARFAPQFRSRLTDIAPSLIHAHFGFDGYDAVVLKKWLDIPLVVHYHGVDFAIREDYLHEHPYRIRVYYKNADVVIQEADLFVGVSQYTCDALIEQGFPAEKIVRHYNSVDLDYFQPDPTVQRERIILFVGRLVEKKGGSYLIQAMQRVQATYPDVKLVFIGDGPYRERLEKQAAESLTAYEFLGTQPSSVVREWMHRSWLFSVPSIVAKDGNVETFGVVFAEAQATGLPVVSFKTGGIPEVVRHEETGLLAEAHDWQTLADYITRLLNDEQLWQRFSTAGIQWVRQAFNLTQQTSKMESIYDDLLAIQREKVAR